VQGTLQRLKQCCDTQGCHAVLSLAVHCGVADSPVLHDLEIERARTAGTNYHPRHAVPGGGMCVCLMHSVHLKHRIFGCSQGWSTARRVHVPAQGLPALTGSSQNRLPRPDLHRTARAEPP
jgi:hypothetical protein